MAFNIYIIVHLLNKSVFYFPQGKQFYLKECKPNIFNLVKENICDLHSASHINYVQLVQKQHQQKKAQFEGGGESVREIIHGEMRLVGSEIKKMKIYIK